MSEIKLSLVVVTHHRPNLLEKCLDAIEQQTLDKSEFEVIVVDNNSTDKTANLIYKYLRRNPHFVYYRETNNGFNYARNRGIKIAKAKNIAFIYDEIILTPEWCQLVVETFDSASPIPAVLTGEIQIWHDEEPPAWFMKEMEESRLYDSPVSLHKNTAIMKQMDAHVAIHLPLFEEQSGLKLAFHINQKYTTKINYRGMISEDPLFIQDHLLDMQSIAYRPNLIAYRYCNPHAFTFKRRRQHSYHQGFSSKKELNFTHVSMHALHALMLLPVVLIGYPLLGLMPKNESLMLAIQSYSKDIGFLSRLFARKEKQTEEVVSSN